MVGNTNLKLRHFNEKKILYLIVIYYFVVEIIFLLPHFSNIYYLYNKSQDGVVLKLLVKISLHIVNPTLVISRNPLFKISHFLLERCLGLCSNFSRPVDYKANHSPNSIARKRKQKTEKEETKEAD